jgi:flagellar biosynthesis/type III secretory pathway M-ring protein FliF/YscJ
MQAANAAQLEHHESTRRWPDWRLNEGRVVGFDAPMPDRLDAGIDVARISGQVKASSIKKISEVVASHPDESVAIIRSWLAEEPADRAA